MYWSQIVAWADKTFGPADDPARLAARANEEMAELLRKATTGAPKEEIAEEAADVVIVLTRMFPLCETTLDEAVITKMQKNRARVWKRDGSGHGYHDKEESPS